MSNEVQWFRNSEYNANSLPSLDETPANQYPHQHPHQPRGASLDGDVRFSQEFQPQGRLSRLKDTRTVSVGIENMGYAEGDLGNGRASAAAGAHDEIIPPQEDEEMLDVYSQVPSNLSITPKDVQEMTPQLNSLASRRDQVNKPSLARGGGSERLSTTYAQVNKPKRSSAKRPSITVTAAEPDTVDSTGSEYPASPEEAMRAAEWSIVNGESAKEFVVMGQHRKLSLPKDDLGIYANF